MKVLYYCFEYYCDYGARTHAREFFAALQKHESVDLSLVYPECVSGGKNSGRQGPQKKSSFVDLLRAITPSSVKCLLHLWFPQFSQRINYKRLKRIVRENGIDLIVMRAMRDFMLISKLKRDMPEVKLIVEVNALLFMEMRSGSLCEKFYMKAEINQLMKADGVSVVSAYLKTLLLQNGLQSKRVLVNQNGVNPDHFRRKDINISELRQTFGIPAESFVLGYVGGMESWRKIPVMVNLFLEMVDEGHRKLFLVIVGDGSDKCRIQKVISNKSDSANNILCMERISYEDVPALTQAFDIALFPFTNPFVSPLKIFEYLAMSVPVVGPDVPSVREIFQDGEHMLLTKQDGSDFCKNILKLYESDSLRTQIAESGKEYVLSDYTWDKNVVRLVEYIKVLDDVEDSMGD